MMKCKKCGKETCEHNLGSYLGIKFPCDGCFYNKPIKDLAFCTYPSQHRRLDCPYVDENVRNVLEDYKEKRRKEIDDYDEVDPYLDNLVDSIADAMREYEKV